MMLAVMHDGCSHACSLKLVEFFLFFMMVVVMHDENHSLTTAIFFMHVLTKPTCDRVDIQQG